MRVHVLPLGFSYKERECVPDLFSKHRVGSSGALNSSWLLSTRLTQRQVLVGAGDSDDGRQTLGSIGN